MKLNHALIALAVAVALLCGTVFWAFGLQSDLSRLEDEKQAMEDEAKRAAPSARPSAARSAPSRGIEVEALQGTVERLQKQLDRSGREWRGQLVGNGRPVRGATVLAVAARDLRPDLEPNEQSGVRVLTGADGTFALEGLPEGLNRIFAGPKDQPLAPLGDIQVSRGARAHVVYTAVTEGGSSAAAVRPPPPLPLPGLDRPTGPPIVAPPAQPRTEPWGASAGSEIDELSKAVGLSKEQTAQVRQIILDGQQEFERRMIEAGQRGERDLGVIDRIGQEMAARTEQAIRQGLYPEQQRKFDKYVNSLRD
ncbi:MAG: hypothetical protein ACYS22_05390 [Planctomycetota bacterium]